MTLLRYKDLQTGKTTPIGGRLHDLRGGYEAVIAPGAVRHFNVVAARPDKSPPRVYFAPPPEGLSSHRGEPGKYELEIEAVSAAALPVPARFLLEFDRSGKVKLTMVDQLG
jgi:hypothetical protein